MPQLRPTQPNEYFFKRIWKNRLDPCGMGDGWQEGAESKSPVLEAFIRMPAKGASLVAHWFYLKFHLPVQE